MGRAGCASACKTTSSAPGPGKHGWIARKKGWKGRHHNWKVSTRRRAVKPRHGSRTLREGQTLGLWTHECSAQRGPTGHRKKGGIRMSITPKEIGHVVLNV